MNTNFDLRLSPEMPHLAVLPVRDGARAPAVLALDSSVATAEVANTITHGLGFLLSLVAAVVLIGWIAWRPDSYIAVMDRLAAPIIDAINAARGGLWRH